MKRPVVLWCLGVGILSFAAALANGAGKGTAGKLPPDRALQRKAERHTASGSFSAVLTDFARQAGVTIQVDWATLAKTGVTEKTPVAVRVENVTYRQVLEVILSRVGRSGHPLGFRTDAEDVIISTHRQVLRMEDGARRTIAKLSAASSGKVKAKKRRVTLSKSTLPGVNFDRMAFKDTLKFFQTVTGENFHINWRALKTEGIDLETPITIKVKGVSIGRAMDLVFSEVNADRDKFTSVYWVIDQGVVLISTGNALNKSTITRVIDAGGALLVQPDTKGPRIDLNVQSENNPSQSSTSSESIWDDDDQRDSNKEDNYAEQKKKHTEKVLNAIKMMIGADMWDPDGKGSLRVLNNKIVITQTRLGFKLLESALR